jgi:hypothetical protein
MRIEETKIEGEIVSLEKGKDGMIIGKIRITRAFCPHDEIRMLVSEENRLGEKVSITVSFLGPYKAVAHG